MTATPRSAVEGAGPEDRDQYWARLLQAVASGDEPAVPPSAIGLPWASTESATSRYSSTRVRKYRTTLFRMEAGASFPSHKHGDAEELFVLEGDLTVNDVKMVAGDYCRAASLHGVATTEHGCVVLVVSSELDELMPAQL